MLKRTSCPSGSWPCEGYPEGGFTPCYKAPNVTAAPYWTTCADAAYGYRSGSFAECLVKPEKNIDEWRDWIRETFGGIMTGAPGECNLLVIRRLRQQRERLLLPLCTEGVEEKCACGLDICEESDAWITRTCTEGGYLECKETMGPLPIILIVLGVLFIFGICRASRTHKIHTPIQP